MGTHLRQAGSLVAADRLRFDFTHNGPLTPEDLHSIEALVNQKILEDLPVATDWTSLREAQEKGAMALFGEKYGERVRQVVVPDFSRELCGGCHVRRTGEIGYLRVEMEGAIASGTRRIEAVTGSLAYHHAESDRRLLRELSGRLGARREDLAARVEALQEEIRAMKDAQAKQSREGLKTHVARLVAEARAAGGPSLVVARVEASGVEELRTAGDWIRQDLPGGGGLLAAEIDGKLSIVCAVGAKATGALNASEWARDAISVAGGKGGGRPEQAVAGAKDTTRLAEVLDRGRAFAHERLKEPVH
jgi:alanyl-tRNA synthetase